MTALRAVRPNRACEARSCLADVRLDLGDAGDAASGRIVADEMATQDDERRLEGRSRQVRPVEDAQRQYRSEIGRRDQEREDRHERGDDGVAEDLDDRRPVERAPDLAHVRQLVGIRLSGGREEERVEDDDEAQQDQAGFDERRGCRR